MSKSSELKKRIEAAYEVLKFNADPELRMRVVEIVEKASSPSQTGKLMKELMQKWQNQAYPPVGSGMAGLLERGAIALAQIKRDTPEDYEELIQMYIQD